MTCGNNSVTNNEFKVKYLSIVDMFNKLDFYTNKPDRVPTGQGKHGKIRECDFNEKSGIFLVFSPKFGKSSKLTWKMQKKLNILNYQHQ